MEEMRDFSYIGNHKIMCAPPRWQSAAARLTGSRKVTVFLWNGESFFDRSNGKICVGQARKVGKSRIEYAVVIAEREDPLSMVETLIHECGHCIEWKMSEEEIRAATARTLRKVHQKAGSLMATANDHFPPWVLQEEPLAKRHWILGKLLEACE